MNWPETVASMLAGAAIYLAVSRWLPQWEWLVSLACIVILAATAILNLIAGSVLWGAFAATMAVLCTWTSWYTRKSAR